MAHASCLGASALTAVLTFLGLSHAHAGPIQLPHGRTLNSVNFERHVHALLDRQGCNGGACHGSSAGRGDGFRLSLFAESAERDHGAMLRSSRGRLINFGNPDQSLLLLKPTLQVAHEGGARLVKDSWEYQVLRQWIAEGAPRHRDSSTIARVVVEPRDCCFTGPGQCVQLKVWVTFADGSREDMTPFCDFRLPEEPDGTDASRDARPVEVTRLGEVISRNPGATWIRAFYRGQAAPVCALVALPPRQDYPQVSENNIIDREVFALLRKLNIEPAELTDDRQFLRRVSIDTTASLPRPDEVRRFLADPHPTKRAKKIDELLSHPRHAALWATLMIDMLQPRWGDRADINTVRWSQMGHDWFRKRFQENMPFDQIVRGVLVATSREGRTPAAWLASQKALDDASRASFFTNYAERETVDLVWRTLNGNPFFPQDTAELLASAFLGIDLHCAQCHRHPLAPWTPADQRAFANIFGRVRVGTAPDLKPLVDQELGSRDKKEAARQRLLLSEVWLTDPPGSVWTDPDTGAGLPPRAPGGAILDGPGDPRETLWRWLVAKDNPHFARHIVNRVWAHYFGIGLVEPVGSISSAISGHYPALLDLLARDFIDHGFNLRRLERTILQSRVYQLSAQTKSGFPGSGELFAHATPRHLPSRMFADLLLDTLDGPLPWPKGVPPHLRAIETTADNAFLPTTTRDLAGSREALFRLFNRRELAHSCERGGWGGSSGYLHLIGSSPFNQLIKDSPRVRRLAGAKANDVELVSELAELMLTRPLRESERQHVNDYFKDGKEPRRVQFENVIWALINTREFTFRH